jgi:O-antigen ligase
MLRRTLLLLATALLVARPVVRGEDPGLLQDLSEPSGMVLTLLWGVLGVGWAAWRLWSRKGEWYGGVVEIALVAAAVCVFVSAAATARYKHPARLIAWEWLGLAFAFFLLRQLAVASWERRGLFAALLANAVALSAHAVYEGVAGWGDRGRAASATYANPDNLAGCLVLLLPALAAAVVICRSSSAPPWQTSLAAVCALLAAAAIGLTHSGPALLAIALVGIAAAVIGYRYWRAHRPLLLAGQVLVAASILGAYHTRFFTSDEWSKSAAARLEIWGTTWKMIGDRPWWGWGPGNFSRTYPRYMEESSAGFATAPHNFLLEMWADSGPFAALAVAAALAWLIYRVIRTSLSREPPAEQGAGSGEQGREAVSDLRAGSSVLPAPCSPLPASRSAGDSRLNDSHSVRWEFYLGGMLGLLLGFGLRLGETPQSGILAEGGFGGLRSVVWFAAFALFEQVPWSDRGRAISLMAGVAALLVHLIFSNGIGLPSVAGVLWIAVALALNCTNPKPITWIGGQKAALALPLPFLGAVVVVYYLYVFYPVATSALLTRQAREAGRAFALLAKQEKWDRNQASRFMTDEILKPLQQAAAADPDDARTRLQMAGWYGELFALLPQELTHEKEAFIWARSAELLDPEGPRAYQAKYELFVRFGKLDRSQADLRKAQKEKAKEQKNAAREQDLSKREMKFRESAREQFRQAAKSLVPYLEYDPIDAEVRYQLADALFEGEDWAGVIEQAQEGLRLDEVARPPRRLPDAKLRNLREWLDKACYEQALAPTGEER